MIENIYGRHKGKQVICDGCGDGFEASDWIAAREQMKEDGWQTKKVGEHFEHYCPMCREG